MINKSEIFKFNSQQMIAQKKRNKMNNLINKYKHQAPNVNPFWDLTAEAINYNDISAEIINSGLVLYKASMNDIWCYIYDSSVYEGNTLWFDTHNNTKIANVINCWERCSNLSPIFFRKHITKDFLLVADGRHRLTVARYMDFRDIYFYLESSNCKWLTCVLPTAIQLK
jgi:hypothetical protein